MERTTVVPTAGFHEEAAAASRGDPLAVVLLWGFARAQATLSVIVQLTRRTRRTKTLLQVLRTAVGVSSRASTLQNFRTIESSVESAISLAYTKCASAFPDGSAKSCRATNMHVEVVRLWCIRASLYVHRCASMCCAA